MRHVPNNLAPVAFGPMGRTGRGILVLGALAALLPCWLGCQNRTASETGTGASLQLQAGSGWKEEVLEYAVNNLQRLDEFRDDEMREQIVSRLNQWIRTQKLPPDWRPDPLLATLPEEVAAIPMVKAIDELEFSSYDGYALEEAVALRDVSRWARGEEIDDLSRSKMLFDWTIRNIQQEPPEKIGHIDRTPWETLFFGRGTALERAWVFLLLLRQQAIDAAMLAVPETQTGAEDQLRPWVVAVFVEGELYLFDPALGIPVPAAGGIGFDEEGLLDIQPATFREVRKDPSLLKKLDVEGYTYPVSQDQLQEVVALLEGSPSYLSVRMALLESQLVGEQKIVLTAAPSELAKRIQAAGKIEDVRLWASPMKTLSRKANPTPEMELQSERAMVPFRIGTLWQGRLLYFKGRFTGQDSAVHYFQLARPSNQNLAALDTPAPEGATPEQAAQMDRAMKALLYRAKQDASYWLGLIAYQQKNYRSATDYFVKRTLQASPNGPWTQGALYNLARTYEARDQREKAAELLRADPRSPGRHGNLLRAQWLEQKQPEPGPNKPPRTKNESPENAST